MVKLLFAAMPLTLVKYWYECNKAMGTRLK